MDYLTRSAPGFDWSGSLALGGFVLWLATIAGVVMWLRSQPPKNPLRQAYRRQISIGLLIIAGIGVVNSLARIFAIPVVEWALWGYVLVVAWLVFGAYALWYRSNKLPEQIAAAGRTKPKSVTHRTPSGTPNPSKTAAEPQEPRPVAMTGRRDARRSRKRSKR